MSREAELTQSEGARHKARQMKEMELQLIRLADITTVVSTYELSILRKELPDYKIRLLPFARSTQSFKKSFLERKDIVFVGSYQHTPNVDAVKFFTQEIMPLIRQSLSGVRFYVVGSRPPLDVNELACEDIIITDFIPDLTSFLNNVRISVAPLRYGAGIKGKIGGAMAVGLPVVATPIAAEGMSLTPGVNILIGEDPKAFANQIITLYQDENLWDSLSNNSLTFAERVWGAESAWNILANTLAEIDITVTRNSHSLSLYTDHSALY
jgi:glycosyltransferase involved in cell wall biosynthesis